MRFAQAPNVALSTMAFKLTYTDGQEAEYNDDTAWEVDDGVLKMGRTEGDWTVLVSPSHWAVIEVGNAASRDGKSEKDKAAKEKSDDSKSDNSKSDDSKSDDDDESDGDKKDD